MAGGAQLLPFFEQYVGFGVAGCALFGERLAMQQIVVCRKHGQRFGNHSLRFVVFGGIEVTINLLDPTSLRFHLHLFFFALREALHFGIEAGE